MSHVKSAPFAAGILFGVVVALLALIALRDGTPASFAQNAASGPATAGNMTIVTGMSQQNLNDLIYVLSVSPNGTSRHLAVYQCPNGRALKLLATREITWDLQVPELKNEPPHVLEIKKEVEDAIKRREKDLKDKLGAGAGEPPK